MAIRIDVVPTIPDARAEVKKKEFQGVVGRGTIRAVHIADSYLIDTSLSVAGLQKVRLALTNPRMEESHTGRFLPKHFDWAVEIGFLPGVTDNVGTTAREMIADAAKHAFREGEQVYSSQTFFIEGDISRVHAEKIAAGLHNPLIQSA